MPKTFKLWLEKDRDIPHFKRLSFAKVEVPLADVLLKGIHPWQGSHVEGNLAERFVQILNSSELKLAELAQFKYCEDVSDSSGCYYTERSAFEDLLERLGKNVCFVESLTFGELVSIAKEMLRQQWSHEVAYKLLSNVHLGFDQMRAFLKAKDKQIKLSGYSDIEQYDLRRILSLEDFEGEDSVIISQGIPTTNFRLARFLDRVTDERGFLKLTESIRDFQIEAKQSESFYSESVTYNCRRDSNQVTFRPELDRKQSKRAWAREFASRWREDQGRYCFTTSIEQVSHMIEEKRFVISFPTLNYTNPREDHTSSAQIAHKRATLYCVGRYLTGLSSGDQIRDVLRVHKVSMSGRKEQLLEKLARLSVQMYRAREKEMDVYFSRHRFVRVAGESRVSRQRFPILEGLDLRNMILAIYILKHTRGNAVLDARHSNDTFDLIDLARSLVRGEVSVEGSFMPVE